MLAPYERRLVFSYLANAARRLSGRNPAAADLMAWAIENAGILNFEIERTAPPPGRRRGAARRVEGDRISEQEWAKFGEALREEARNCGSARPNVTSRRIRRLAAITGISRTDTRILEALLLYQTNPVMESLIDESFRCMQRRGGFNCGNAVLPFILDMSSHSVSARFRPETPLVRSGLLSADNEGDLSMSGRLIRLAVVSGKSLDVRELILGKPQAPELEWSDFDHVGNDRDHVERLLKGALQTGEPGVNIFLHGPPGTGKTQFCRMVAERLGVALYSAGEGDEEGGEPQRSDRLRDLILTQALLARERSSLVLFDEMVDILPDGNWSFVRRRRGPGEVSCGSRLFVNRLLEAMPVPTLWTANPGDRVPEVLLRRMKFALELRLPPPRIRARIWSRQLARNGIAAGPEEAMSLATAFEAPPGVAAEVTAAARLVGGDIAAVRRGLNGLSRALSCERPARNVSASFDLSLMQSDTDLIGLSERLVSGSERRFSLCLQGPPGTGKSACVRYIADRLGLEVVQKRASDLVSPWVGETEKNIAGAFREARDDDAFLVFDEADSLLADRRRAVRNWEVSQTNEMLTWMESHPLPFACTTNFGDRLDTATLRRFVFKIELDYLSRDRAVSAFRSYFDLDAPAEVSLLTTLTPGDFAVVRRKAEILGVLRNPQALAVLLRQECDAKPERRAPIGFVQ